MYVRDRVRVVLVSRQLLNCGDGEQLARLPSALWFSYVWMSECESQVLRAGRIYARAFRRWRKAKGPPSFKPPSIWLSPLVQVAGCKHPRRSKLADPLSASLVASSRREEKMSNNKSVSDDLIFIEETINNSHSNLFSFEKLSFDFTNLY